jgi:hypothetical protein
VDEGGIVVLGIVVLGEVVVVPLVSGIPFGDRRPFVLPVPVPVPVVDGLVLSG